MHAQPQPHTCNATVPHHIHGGDWTTICRNPIEAKCYKCDRFFCDNHIRKHECDASDEHPESD